MWLSPKWFCFFFIYFVLYHGPEASKVQIKLTYLLTYLLTILVWYVRSVKWKALNNQWIQKNLHTFVTQVALDHQT